MHAARITAITVSARTIITYNRSPNSAYVHHTYSHTHTYTYIYAFPLHSVLLVTNLTLINGLSVSGAPASTVKSKLGQSPGKFQENDRTGTSH